MNYATGDHPKPKFEIPTIIKTISHMRELFWVECITYATILETRSKGWQ